MDLTFSKSIVLLTGLLSSLLACVSPSHAQRPQYTTSDRTFHHYSIEHYKYKPKERNLDYDKLMRRMGDNFDPEWMSVNQPVDGTAPQVHQKGQIDTTLSNKLSRVNFTYVGDNGEIIELKHTEREAVEKWLLKRASCQVDYSWQDQTEFFWPRWIKTGFCDHNKGCSWPPGMLCVPADSRPIKILNWQCRKRKRKARALHVRYGDDYDDNGDYVNKTHAYSSRVDYRSVMRRKNIKKRQKKREKRNKQKIRCRWSKVRYPVTTQCYCSC